jgi:hypothetical protein
VIVVEEVEEGRRGKGFMLDDYLLI